MQIEAGFIFWSKRRPKSNTILQDASNSGSTEHATGHLLHLRGLKRGIQSEKQLIHYCILETILQSTQYLASNFMFLHAKIEAWTGINRIFIIDMCGCTL